MHRIILSILVVIFSFSWLYSQNPDDYAINPDSSFTTDVYPEKTGLLSDNKRVRVGMQVGTGISIINKETLLNSYIAPHLEFNLTPRFRVYTGMILMNNNFLNSAPFTTETTGAYNNRFTNTLIYAEGQYQLNKRITVNSLVIKNIVNLNDQTGNPNLNYNFNSMAVGMNYKISEGSSIGFQVQFNEGRTPFNNNPYLFRRSFSASPFSSGYTW